MSENLKDDDLEFDVLGDVLETLRLRGTIFFQSELCAPWGFTVPEAGIPRFHIALSGNCYVGDDQDNAVNIQETDVVMLPTGDAHWIADQPGRELVAGERVIEACELGNPQFQTGEVTNRLMCGLVHFDQESAHPVLDALPNMLHFPKLEPTEPVWMTVTLIDAEMRRTKDRGGRIVDRLSEVLFLQLLNRYVKENKESTGFLAALRDRRIRQALALIHQAPEHDWSLTSLGERIGMSRATLIRHFQDAVGVAPMTYITNWRIMKAYNLIKYTSDALDEIAESVGFASARTLSKAFQRHYDCTPNELRLAQSKA